MLRDLDIAASDVQLKSNPNSSAISSNARQTSEVSLESSSESDPINCISFEISFPSKAFDTTSVTISLAFVCSLNVTPKIVIYAYKGLNA